MVYYYRAYYCIYHLTFFQKDSIQSKIIAWFIILNADLILFSLVVSFISQLLVILLLEIFYQHKETLVIQFATYNLVWFQNYYSLKYSINSIMEVSISAFVVSLYLNLILCNQLTLNLPYCLNSRVTISSFW